MENKQAVNEVPTKSSKHIEIRDSQDYADDYSNGSPSAFLDDKFHIQSLIYDLGDKQMSKMEILREEKRMKKDIKKAKNSLSYYDQT